MASDYSMWQQWPDLWVSLDKYKFAQSAVELPLACKQLPCLALSFMRSVLCGLQAGVDLGTVRADQQAAKKRQGKARRGATPAAELRPKRRAPISQARPCCIHPSTVSVLVIL